MGSLAASILKNHTPARNVGLLQCGLSISPGLLVFAYWAVIVYALGSGEGGNDWVSCSCCVEQGCSPEHVGDVQKLRQSDTLDNTCSKAFDDCSQQTCEKNPCDPSDPILAFQGTCTGTLDPTHGTANPEDAEKVGVHTSYTS